MKYKKYVFKLHRPTEATEATEMGLVYMAYRILLAAYVGKTCSLMVRILTFQTQGYSADVEENRPDSKHCAVNQRSLRSQYELNDVPQRYDTFQRSTEQSIHSHHPHIRTQLFLQPLTAKRPSFQSAVSSGPHISHRIIPDRLSR